jgi:tyrosine-protein kinase Etk/Wzc
VLVLGLTGVLGLLLGVVAVFIRRALHAGVEDPNEVERELGLTAYAAVPFVDEQRRLERLVMRGQGAGKALLALSDPDSVAIESMRSLRTALHFGMVDAENNLIVITGPEPGVGKSFVTINLGAVLALGGKKVLVMDMDLRRGRLHQYLGGSRSPGLTEFIASNDLNVVRKTGIEGLDVITTGTLPPNPAELVMHARTIELLQRIAKLYDYVLIDTPPVLPVTDAALIGRLAGTTLLVLKAGEHPMRMIEEALRRLQQGGVQVRGTIFNQVGVSGTVGYGYRYGYSPVYARYKQAKD